MTTMELDGRRWATRGETGPSVHGLRKLPAPKPTPGDAVNVEEIGSRSFFQLKRRDVMMVRLAKQGAENLLELHRRVKEAQRSPYPSGGAEGSRKSGTSDPTAAAALRPRILDPAELYFVERDLALKHLARADAHRRRALSMSQASGTILKDALEELAEEEAKGEERLCPSCAKVGMRTPRGSDKEVGQESDLCGWCRAFERDHGRLPPRKLLTKRANDERIYAHDIENALRGEE